MRSKTFVCIFLFLLLLTGVAAAQESLRVYYVDGQSLEQMTDHDVTVTVSLKDAGKVNWLTVYVVNDSDDPVNVVPATITLHQTWPKNEDLHLKTERELQRTVARGVFWGQVVANIGAGLTLYGSAKAVHTPDYEAQARWLARADTLAARGQAVLGVIGHEYLRATTVFPGSRFAGKLCFSRDKSFGSGMALITFGSRIYQFPLPAPTSTPTPSYAPELPIVGSVTFASATRDDPAQEEAENPTATRRAGVLGVSGANWTQGGANGVEVLDVAPDSAAEAGGLRIGQVITVIGGRHIRSTEDLASVLSENGPGTRTTVSYLFKSNLGWMPSQTIVILTNR
jgi:hypothetical protein